MIYSELKRHKMKIEHYLLIISINEYNLSMIVTEYSHKGYLPYGSPYAIYNNEKLVYEHCQAVIKYADPNLATL